MREIGKILDKCEDMSDSEAQAYVDDLLKNHITFDAEELKENACYLED